MNVDVSGIGIRVSFYLQDLFLAYLSARSGSDDEIAGALTLLIVTNMAMASTSLMLGLKPNPDITLFDAIVVLYLLGMSWFTVVLSLPSGLQRFARSAKTLKLSHIVQSILVFVFAFTVLARAETFGSIPSCNAHAVVALFYPISALRTGRIVGWVVVSIAFGIYASVTIWGYIPLRSKMHAQQWLLAMRSRASIPGSTRSGNSAWDYIELDTEASLGFEDEDDNSKHYFPRAEYQPPVAWDMVVELFLKTLLWAVAVANTELLIRWNHFEQSGASLLQFGQILPLFLVVPPFLSVINAFRELGLMPIE